MIKKIKNKSTKIIKTKLQYNELKNFHFFKRYKKLWRIQKNITVKKSLIKRFSWSSYYMNFYQTLSKKNKPFYSSWDFKNFKHKIFSKMLYKINLKNYIVQPDNNKKIKFLKFSDNMKINVLKNILKTNFYKNYNANFLILNFKLGYERNIYLNISKFNGEVLKKYSGGMFYKGKLKYSNYALEDLFFQSSLIPFLSEVLNEKQKLIINLSAKKKNRRIKFYIKKILKENYPIKRFIHSIHTKSLIAHNGVRKRKLPRK